MNRQQILAFSLTFLVYAGLHSLRQGWSLSKAVIKDKPQLNADKPFLGLVDTCYLLSYSAGMMTLGNLIHKIQLKYFVSIGMIISSIFFMAVALYFQIYGQFNHAFVIVFMCLNGFFQCTGWPGIVGIMGNWFQKGKTGLILGIWAINANIGNIIAELLCNILEVQFDAEWTANFYSTGIFTIIIAILVILFLKDKPKQKQDIQKALRSQKPQDNQQHKQHEQHEQHEESILTTQDQIKSGSKQQQQKKLVNDQPKKKMSIFRAFCFPKVPSYVIGYAMLKGCIYGLLFWLPTYLTEKNLGDQKGYIAAMVDTGSFIGGLIIGYLGDRLHHRALFLSPLLFCSSFVMFCSAYFLTDVAWQYYIAMFLVGITIGGPYNIIGTVITIDLGRQAKDMGGSTATISALIEGTAAIFAAGSQQVIGLLSETFTFYIFFAECIVAAIVLFPLFLTQYRLYKSNSKQQKDVKLEQQK